MGQKIAALALTNSTQPLVALSISPKLQVITSDANAPDGESLAAFAQDQGLSSDTVHWLLGGRHAFGDGARIGPQPESSSDQATPTGDHALLMGLMATIPGSGTEPQNLDEPPVNDQIEEPQSVQPQPVVGEAHAAMLHSARAALGNEAGLAPAAALPMSPASVQPQPVVGAAHAPILNAARAALGNEAGLAPAAALPVSPASVQLNAANGPEHPIIARLQSSLLSDSGGTPQTSDTDGSEASTLLVAAQANVLKRLQIIKMQWEKTSAQPGDKQQKPSQPLTIIIDLDQLPVQTESPKLYGQAQIGNPGAPAAQSPVASLAEPHASRSLSLSGNQHPESTTPASNASLISDKFQELSQRLGESIGQRMISAMQQGQWHLKLTLRPAHLGQIDIEMRMRDGGLDATFAASHAATRELLQEGLNRLKSSFHEIGMDVASVSVRDGQSRQSGGESTTGSRAFQGLGAAPENKDPVPATANARGSSRASHDGLDVMV